MLCFIQTAQSRCVCRGSLHAAWAEVQQHRTWSTFKCCNSFEPGQALSLTTTRLQACFTSVHKRRHRSEFQTIFILSRQHPHMSARVNALPPFPSNLLSTNGKPKPPSPGESQPAAHTHTLQDTHTQQSCKSGSQFH